MGWTRRLERSFWIAATCLLRLAFTGFRHKYWRQIWSTILLERVNKEIEWRTDVTGVFTDPAALLCLAGAVLVEQHDEWEAADRRYFTK